MVPIRLELQNFLSYGTDVPPLDFEAFDVPCLSGGNGEGKSALLNAMTWAVKGEARKSSGKRKPDDALVCIGSRPLEVTFTFDLEESRYRVNFALRVALEQLLAERSGIRVRTLVTDEGFGTQVEEGIEPLVEAIQAIREDFAKILVITHLTHLKQAFPVRIEVEKDPVVGSTFDLIGA